MPTFYNNFDSIFKNHKENQEFIIEFEDELTKALRPYLNKYTDKGLQKSLRKSDNIECVFKCKYYYLVNADFFLNQNLK